MLKLTLTTLLAISCTFANAANHKQKHEEKEYGGKLEVQTLKAESVTDDSQPIHYPKTDNPEVKTIKVMIPSKAETGWHYHPYPGYGLLMAGTIEVTQKNKQTTRYKTGDVIYEMVKTPHNGRCISKTDCEVIMTFTGVANEPVSVMLPEQHHPH